MTVSHPRTLRVAALAYMLVNLVFVLKYSLRIGVGVAVAACCFYLLFAGLLMCFCGQMERRSWQRVALVVAAVSLVGLVAVQLSIDPYSLKVDRWSALHNWTECILHGRYPYAARTHLGGYGSPLPVWQLLHVPFVLLGDVGFSAFVALLFYVWTLCRLRLSKATVLRILLLWCLAPAFVYEVAVRSDLATNFLVCCGCINLMWQCKRSTGCLPLWQAVVCGLLLSTRLSVALPLVVFFLPLWWTTGLGRKFSFPFIALLTLGLTCAPFLLWHELSPGATTISPLALQTARLDFLCAAAIVVVTLIAALGWRADLCCYHLLAATSLLAAVVLNFVSLSFRFDNTDWFSGLFDTTYLNMSLPFLTAAMALAWDKTAFRKK